MAIFTSVQCDQLSYDFNMATELHMVIYAGSETEPVTCLLVGNGTTS